MNYSISKDLRFYFSTSLRSPYLKAFSSGPTLLHSDGWSVRQSVYRLTVSLWIFYRCRNGSAVIYNFVKLYPPIERCNFEWDRLLFLDHSFCGEVTVLPELADRRAASRISVTVRFFTRDERSSGLTSADNGPQEGNGVILGSR